MAILGLETTGPYCSVALLDDRGEVDCQVGTDRFQHLATITTMVEKLLEKNHVTWEQIETLAVSVGPGSFTGIRIGVSTARAISQLTGISLLPVPTLEAFALQENRDDFLICPILDARRGQVYGGAYHKGKEIVEGGPYLLEELVAEIRPYLKGNQKPFFVGDGVPVSLKKLEDLLGKEGFAYGEGYQSARGVLTYAQTRGKEGPFLMTPHELQPRYMRMAEAERQRLAREKNR